MHDSSAFLAPTTSPGAFVPSSQAMEQQTISITKAGIQATLNARTSVLAAANPIHGRYDPTRTLRQNINISAPIMSRFDLFFVVLDQLDPDRDAAIAEHIVRVHQRKAAVVTSVPYSMETLLNYIRFARTKEPVLTGRAKQSIVRLYRKLREADAFSASSSAYRVTVRQLESMIRLSEAVARLHLHDVVLEKDVQVRTRELSLLHGCIAAICSIGLCISSCLSLLKRCRFPLLAPSPGIFCFFLLLSVRLSVCRRHTV